RGVAPIVHVGRVVGGLEHKHVPLAQTEDRSPAPRSDPRSFRGLDYPRHGAGQPPCLLRVWPHSDPGNRPAGARRSAVQSGLCPRPSHVAFPHRHPDRDLPYVQWRAGPHFHRSCRGGAYACRDSGRFGYQTAAFVSSFVLNSMWGLSRGFEVYDDATDVTAGASHSPSLLERRGDPTVDRVLAWLNLHSDRPFFLWVHLYDP